MLEECHIYCCHGVRDGVVDCCYHDPGNVVPSCGGGHGCASQGTGDFYWANWCESVNRWKAFQLDLCHALVGVKGGAVMFHIVEVRRWSELWPSLSRSQDWIILLQMCL